MKWIRTRQYALLLASAAAAATALAGTPVDDIKARLDKAGIKAKSLQAFTNNTIIVDLEGSGIKDLTPLKGAPVKMLCLASTGVTNLALLKGMPLEVLDLRNTRVSDITPLKGMPLDALLLAGTQVRDLSPLAAMKLTKITFSPTVVTNAAPVLRTMKSLHSIGIDDTNPWPAKEFWKKYDAGEFTKKEEKKGKGK